MNNFLNDYNELYLFFKKRNITKTPYRGFVDISNPLFKSWMKSQIKTYWHHCFFNSKTTGSPEKMAFQETLRIYCIEKNMLNLFPTSKIDKTIIFCHLPKTAGTSISYSIPYIRFRDCYLFKYPAHQENNKHQDIPQAISGHFPYGVHNWFENLENYSYFTFLRNPIDRCISSFNWFHFEKTKLFLSCKNIYEYLEQCLEQNINCNCMCRQLSGIEKLDDIDLSYHNSAWFQHEGCYFRSILFGKRPYTEEKMKMFYQVALENLSTKFDFVGKFENIENDFRKLCKLYNFDCALSKTKFRSSHKKIQNLFDIEDKKIFNLLAEMNKYDILLYEYFAN